MDLTIPVEQLFVYIFLLSYHPCVIEIFLDRPVTEVNLMNYLRDRHDLHRNSLELPATEGR